MRAATLVVRGGEDARLPHVRGDDGAFHEGHTVFAVYREMFFQIQRDYASLPDPRSLKMHEIRAYYEALRGELQKHTKKPAKG